MTDKKIFQLVGTIIVISSIIIAALDLFKVN